MSLVLPHNLSYIEFRGIVKALENIDCLLREKTKVASSLCMYGDEKGVCFEVACKSICCVFLVDGYNKVMARFCSCWNV